jgi:hypothetical protein
MKNTYIIIAALLLVGSAVFAWRNYSPDLYGKNSGVDNLSERPIDTVPPEEEAPTLQTEDLRTAILLDGAVLVLTYNPSLATRVGVFMKEYRSRDPGEDKGIDGMETKLNATYGACWKSAEASCGK